MDYKSHYLQLIERAKNRTLDGYSEKHHITPKCLGGSNSKDNIVRLTPEEHYIAHLLLVKIYPDDHRLLWAAVAMTNKTKIMSRKNKLYGWLRRMFSEEMRKRNIGRKFSEEVKEKMRNAKIGKKTRPHSEETKRKMSVASLGVKKSDEHRKSISISKIGKKRNPISEEVKNKIRKSNIESAKNRDFSYLQDEEYKKEQSKKMKEIWKIRKNK